MITLQELKDVTESLGESLPDDQLLELIKVAVNDP